MNPAETINNDLANVSSLLKQMAGIHPDKPAAVCYAGCDQNNPARLTFRQLDRESDRLAYGLEKSGIKKLLITCGKDGMWLFERESSPIHMPAVTREEVADVTGAGDDRPDRRKRLW